MSNSGFKSKTAVATLILLLVLPVLSILNVSPVLATVSITSISPDSGPVGTEVTVTGKIDTFNGPYEIYFDANGDMIFTANEKVAEGYATGTDVSASFVVPNAVKGARRIKLLDVDAGTYVYGYFTVESKYKVSASPEYIQEGLTTTIKVELTGGEKNKPSEYYVVNVKVTVPTVPPVTYTASLTFATNATGYGSGTVVYPTGFSAGANTNYVGTYNIVVDQTAPEAQSSVASESFDVGLTDKTSYGRTDTVNIRAAGYGATEDVTVDITDPSGSLVYSKTVTAVDGVVTDAWTIPKDADTGTYHVTLTGTTTSKTPSDEQDFEVTSVGLTVTITDQPLAAYQRTETATMKFYVKYPDGTFFTEDDLGSVTDSVAVYKGTTPITMLTPTFESATNKWVVEWTVPKGASLGTDYVFKVLANHISDSADNTGPAEDVVSNAFEVKKAVLTVTITDQPSAGPYKAGSSVVMKFKVAYPDGTFFASGDLGEVKVGVYKGATLIATLSLGAGAYDAGTKKWTASWTIPPGTAVGDDYYFKILADAIKDKVSPPNSGPAVAVSSSYFSIVAPAITLEPSIGLVGTKVTVSGIHFEPEATVTIIFDGSDVTPTPAPVVKSDGTFTAEFLVPAGYPYGTYTVTASDTAGNTAEATFTIASPEAAQILQAIDEVEKKLDAGGAFYNFVNDWFKSISNTLDGIVTTYLSPILEGVDEIKALLKDETYGLAAIKSAVSGLSTQLSTAVETITGTISGLDTKLGTFTDTDNVASLLYEIKADVEAITVDLTPVLNAISGAQSDIVSAIDSAKTDILTAVSGLGAKLDLLVVDADLNGVPDFIEEIDHIEAKLNALPAWGDLVTKNWADLTSALSGAVSSIQGSIDSAKSDILSAISSLGTQLSSAVDSITGSISSAKSDIVSAIDSAKSEIIASMPTLDLTPVLTAIQGNSTAIIGAIDSVEAKLDNETYGLVAIKSAASGLSVQLSNAVDTITGAVGDAKASILAAIDNVKAKLDNIKGVVDAIKLKTDTINWADITAIKDAVNDIEGKVDALMQSPVAQATSGSGSTTFTASGSKVIYEGSKVGTVTVSLKTTGVGYGERLLIRYYIDPNSPTVYIEKTVTSGTNTAGWTDTAAAWKVEIVYTWRSGTDTVYWSYSVIYPP
jgi:hypothetical protein